MVKKEKSLDDLLQGIKQLLSENSCSFSDEEKVLLGECMAALEDAKDEDDDDDAGPGKKSGLVVKVLVILIKVLTVAHDLKDLF